MSEITSVVEVKSKPVGWIRATIERLQAELQRREREEAASRPPTTEEGKRLQRQLAERTQLNAQAAEQAEAVLQRRLTEARRRWGLRRVADEYLTKHRPPADDDRELAQLLTEVEQDDAIVQRALYGG
ncbi:MAG: hypothetical protein COV75_06825 [Candidatus Omnitrophica bacterium CG11_big_fil_rev_8_21_14_0_20_63_9]|nr:MAG: hypothetical protein COV75_06825 [Candidatus Omnitrophica bacterium CG11_big_fil_rev_8_21_14_0_20_63_9]